MSFQEKTDYFNFADDSTIVITASDENKSATIVQAHDEKGDIVAQEIVGQTAAPACTYVLKADASTGTWYMGKPIAVGSKYYTIASISISTGAGTPPSIQITGEEIPTNSHTDCYYTVPSTTIEMCHHAQKLFGAFSSSGTGCYLTQANYTVSGGLTKATKDGETIAYDISDGKIEAALTFVSTSGSAPTLSVGTGWEMTSPLTKSEPDSDYNQYTCTLTKNLTHTSSSGV